MSTHALAAYLPFLFRRLLCLLTTCHTQISRCFSDHAADIARHTDHREALAHTLSRRLSIFAKNTESNIVFPRTCLNTFQGLHKFGFGPLGTRCQAELRV